MLHLTTAPRLRSGTAVCVLYVDEKTLAGCAEIFESYALGKNFFIDIYRAKISGAIYSLITY
jgi:hypothetical protein